MRLSKEEFCRKVGLTEDQFYGRYFVGRDLRMNPIEYLPEGCSLKCGKSIFLFSLKELSEGCFLKCVSGLWLNSLKRLPENCTLNARYVDLESLKYLPENYYLDATNVNCNIIVPSYKGSPEFYFGCEYHQKLAFEDYDFIQEEPLKYLGSSDSLEVALAEYFLKETV